tara:strand:+ start:286 stop:555 length:270 start_codon:yes stop_codon:yes gene_type:complete
MRTINEKDLENDALQMIPVRNGCSGWCGCTGHCREIAKFIPREEALEWQRLQDIIEDAKEKASNIVDTRDDIPEERSKELKILYKTLSE